MADSRLSRRCFSWIHGHHLVYNACWEDPRLDRVALALGPDDTVAVITSGGCNALDYALDGPRRIVAIDVNPRQNALLELKQAGIRHLAFDEFFDLFGRGRSPLAHQMYRDVLRQDLSPWSQSYWDTRMGYFSGRRHGDSFYFHGTAGLFARGVNLYVDRIARVRAAVTEILHATSVDAQRDIWEGHLRPVVRRGLVRWFFERDLSLALLGVPRPQRDYLERETSGGIFEFMQGCMESVFAHLPLTDNYFWRVYLTGSYSRSCCPEYLKPHHFARLKAGLVDRITPRTGTVAEVLESDGGRFSRLVLLDHMDWLVDADPAGLQREWQTIINCAAPNARILWRSGAPHTDFVDTIETSVRGITRHVGDLLTYATALAASLHPLDRVHTYGSFHIADLTYA